MCGRITREEKVCGETPIEIRDYGRARSESIVCIEAQRMVVRLGGKGCQKEIKRPVGRLLWVGFAVAVNREKRGKEEEELDSVVFEKKVRTMNQILAAAISNVRHEEVITPWARSQGGQQ